MENHPAFPSRQQLAEHAQLLAHENEQCEYARGLMPHLQGIAKISGITSVIYIADILTDEDECFSNDALRVVWDDYDQAIKANDAKMEANRLKRLVGS